MKKRLKIKEGPDFTEISSQYILNQVWRFTTPEGCIPVLISQIHFVGQRAYIDGTYTEPVTGTTVSVEIKDWSPSSLISDNHILINISYVDRVREAMLRSALLQKQIPSLLS